MISPFEIYVVLQMDDVKDALTGLGAISGVAAALAGFVALAGGGHSSYDNKDDIERRASFRSAAIKRYKLSLAVAVLSASSAVLLPSTKTLAAMLIIPAIANNETVQQEASELYTMAKDALKEAIKP